MPRKFAGGTKAEILCLWLLEVKVLAKGARTERVRRWSYSCALNIDDAAAESQE